MAIAAARCPWPPCVRLVREFLWVVQNQWYCSQACGRLAAQRYASPAILSECDEMLVDWDGKGEE